MEATSTSTDFRLLMLNEVDEQDMELLVKGAKRSKTDLEEVKRALLDGRALFWRATHGDKRGIVVTQERTQLGEREMYVLLVAGKGAALMRDHLQETLENFCRLRGIVRICAAEPKAVYKLIGGPLGYKIDFYMISKEICYGR